MTRRPRSSPPFPYPPLSRSDSGTVTVSGLATAVNTVLASLTYTANTEFEGADTLHVTATSTDGTAAPSAPSAEATVAITVEPVSDTPTVSAPTPSSAFNQNT